MTQWIITSSLLILAVLLIRAFGRDRLSARLRYALWGLVLLRLLMPFSIGESALSVRNWLPEAIPQPVMNGQRVHGDAWERSENSRIPATEIVGEMTETTQPSETSQTTQTTETTQTTQMTETTGAVQTQMLPAAQTMNPATMIWCVGMAVVGGVFLGSNVRFWLRLRRSRRLVMTEAVPVYTSEVVETPCLFGFPRGAIYVTHAVWADETALRHVLAHELTHHRHGDHIWSLLRCICVTMHWYNPLVWVAAIASRKDAELACDEGALQRLMAEERTDYARTLLDLTCVGYRGMLITATSMTGSESDLKTRILRILKDPKMPKYVIPVVLVLAAVIALAVFTDAQTDELEGVWYGAREEYASYPATKSAITTQAVFRDGIMRITRFENDRFETSSIYTYTVKDDVLHLERLDHAYGESYAFTELDENSIDFGTVSQSGNHLWCGLLTRGDLKEAVLTDDPLMEITSFTDLARESTWEVDGELSWLEGAIVDMLLRAEITEQRPMPDPLTYSDYCYGITAKENGKTVELIFADGWLYRDGAGYRLANTDVFWDRMLEVTWEPTEEPTDEYGMQYSNYYYRNAPVGLELRTEHEYAFSRHYAPENSSAWKAAWVQAEAACVHEEASHLAEQPMDIVAYVSIDGDVPFLNVYADGTLVYWTECDEGCPWGEHYTRPGDMPKMMALLEPYLKMAADSAARAERQQNINGTWVLESGPVSAVTQLQMAISLGQRYIPSDKSATIIATVDGCIVETAFDVYAENDVFHICWRDGREEAISCRLDGETLTLYDDEGIWVFRKGKLEPVTEEHTDIIRISRVKTKVIRLDMTDEKLAELEILLRAGMEPGDSNIIYSDNCFYQLIGLEDAFDAESVILSDYGTLHFGGESYDLTNWEEIEAFLGTLYRVKY